MLINWYEQNLYVEFEGLAVPRVPTSQEIDRTIGRLQPEITAAYEQAKHRFNKPPKIMARRIRVRWSMPRTPTSDRKIRAQVGKAEECTRIGTSFRRRS